MGSSTLDDLLGEELASGRFFSDPYPCYRRLRESEPVHWYDRWGQWLVTSYEHVKVVLQHPEQFSSAGWEQRFLAQLPAAEQAELPHVMRHYDTAAINNSDPPVHARFRRLISRSFTPRVLADIAPAVRQLVRQQLGNLAEQRRLELMESFAYPIPALVIGTLLGAPAAACASFQAWSEAIVSFVSTGYPEIERARRADDSLRALAELLSPLLDERRREPRDDLVSVLVSARDGEELSPAEAIAACVVLVFAGHETTANLIGNGMHALLASPEQLARLRGDPTLVASAVEEMLRFDAPVQRVRRVALTDVELGGRHIAAGQLVMAFLGSANRDPDHVRDADRFDVGRLDGGHVSFGHGIHFCLGAALSRIEAPIAVSALLDTFPQLGLDPDRTPQWKRNITFRGLHVLPLAASGGKRRGAP